MRKQPQKLNDMPKFSQILNKEKSRKIKIETQIWLQNQSYWTDSLDQDCSVILTSAILILIYIFLKCLMNFNLIYIQSLCSNHFKRVSTEETSKCEIKLSDAISIVFKMLYRETLLLFIVYTTSILQRVDTWVWQILFLPLTIYFCLPHTKMICPFLLPCDL